jgi:hypothetical protein
VSNRRKLRAPATGDFGLTGIDPVLLQAAPAQPGDECCWCDCEVREPEHEPGGKTVMFAHDDSGCPGCALPAQVRIRVAVLYHIAEYPACFRHRQPCEAWQVRIFRMGSAS